MVNKPRRYDRVFWIEVEKIKPNPMQPRHEFEEEALASLADSIRQYGVLQPLVVTRMEIDTSTGTRVEYELVAGERRWRASQLAGLTQVPVIIKDDEGEKLKLELSIIENVQREDLNAIDRALAFKKLVDQFKLRHHEVGKKVGKSREYVSNTIRLLNLPEEVQGALIRRQITEGHCRPILMVSDKAEAQINFYKDIVSKKMSVRMAERISRSIAVERARKPVNVSDPETILWEQKLSNMLGGIVKIEQEGGKGRVSIDFVTNSDMKSFFERLQSGGGDEVEAGEGEDNVEAMEIKTADDVVAEVVEAIVEEKEDIKTEVLDGGVDVLEIKTTEDVVAEVVEAIVEENENTKTGASEESIEAVEIKVAEDIVAGVEEVVDNERSDTRIPQISIEQIANTPFEDLVITTSSGDEVVLEGISKEEENVSPVEQLLAVEETSQVEELVSGDDAGAKEKKEFWQNFL